MIVSTRIKSYNIREFTYPVKHDLRENIPEYVDRNRLSKNRYILFQGIKDKGEVKDWILNEWEFIQQDFKEFNNRKLRKDTGLIIEGIITFSKESRDFVNDESNWNELDKRALNFIRTLEKEWNTKAVYLVRHSDEYTTHYHFAVMNYNYQTHQTIRAKLKKRDTSQLQDKVANAFKDLGFVRGKHLAKRIEEGEFANTRNWGSVFSIHKKLLHEIAELQDKEDELLIKINKYERLVSEKKKKLKELEEKLKQRELQCEEKLMKGQRTLEKYLKRLEKAKKEYGEIIQLKNQLEQVLKELDRVKNENKSLKEENKSLKEELEKSQEEIENLKGTVRAMMELKNEMEEKKKMEEEKKAKENKAKSNAIKRKKPKFLM